MSRDERYGTRDLTFSRWHRYTFDENAGMIDLDALGWCKRCKSPLYVIEATRDVGQEKTTTIAYRVSLALNVSGWLVMYTKGPECVCHSTAMVPGCAHGISAMRIRRITPASTWIRSVAPGTFAAILQLIRENHAASVCATEEELGMVPMREDVPA